MVFFNYSRMQMSAKIVYYGPGLCGKTTNLHWIYGHTAGDSRGEMVSLETETDRTLFFDLLPIDVGNIGGFETRLQLYTVPGQVFYNTTRKLVLKGVDGVVFVVDSQRPMLQANLDAFGNLRENLEEMGLSVDSVPIVLQYNKRDLEDVLSVHELNRALNHHNWAWFEASAVHGQGVFETLKGISKLTLLALRQRLSQGSGESDPPRPQAATTALPRAQAPPAPAARAQAAPAQAAPAPAAPARAAPAPAAPAAPVVATPPRAAPRPPARPAPGPVATPAASPSPPPAAASAAPRKPFPDLAATPAEQARPRPFPDLAAGPRPGSRPASSAPAPERPRKILDAMGELERLRRQTMGPAATPSASSGSQNGHGQLSRNIELTLNRADFQRARRFTLTLSVEDERHQVVEAMRDLEVEIKNPEQLDQVLLKLNIALQSRD